MAARADASRAARWMILGEWRAHPGRVIVAMIAIAVGVALGFAVHLINASALNEFARAVASVNGAADLQVRAASPLGFDEALYPRLARLDGIASASPVVELRAVADAADGVSLTLLGLDMFRVARVTPSLIARASSAADDGAEPAERRAGGNRRQSVRREFALPVSGRARCDRQACRRCARADRFRTRGSVRHCRNPAGCRGRPEHRGGGHRRGAMAVRHHRTTASRGPEAQSRRRRHADAEPPSRRFCRGCEARQPGQRGTAHRQPVARLSRQSRHAGADGASDRRVPGLFGAVAVGRAPARAVRAVARARCLSPRAGRAGTGRGRASSVLWARSQALRWDSCSPMRGCASWAAISAAAISAARGPS